MDQERSNGFRRNSTHQGIYSRPVERRPSKKSSSKDRHGMVYPDSFQQTTIRTVTPDSVSDTGNHSSLSEPDQLSTSAAASPRSTVRSKNVEWDRRREFSPYHSAGDEDDLPPEAKGQRVRSRTTTLDEQRSEISPNFLSRTRNRLNSINTSTTPLNTKVSEESVGSIGYPSIIQSPTYSGPPGGRQRLTRAAAPGGAGLITGVSKNPAAFLSPLSNADSTKILQLMKSTCGRMHGILSFRTATNAQWTSGYCAINVATGSLIYQAKGEVALAKTLIPDLRGCHVRTLFDTDLQSTYLSVSTFTSGLGIQLKPHVNETFDSWLAALLCWQPIRPKGVQNKRTKPQSVTIGDRRLVDRRRNSESAVQKDAAIIKVGKMLLWEKPSVSGARPEPAWKVSTYRQQKLHSPAWQRVSCTLQENGYFKLYTETDANVLAVIQLSQLSRCSVQQLDASVLGDEYCIAIYPQYAAISVSESASRPIFLSLESRVLFEVWFVLLRAFTIPELYGPENAISDDPSRPQYPVNPLPTSTSTTDMFRIERLLSVRITEARLTNASNKEKEPSISKAQSKSAEKSAPSDYYAEVLLDGEIRAKTAVKEKTSTPFWREDFTFNDLPPILSNVSVLLKTLNPVQKDWTLIAHGPYTLDAQLNPMSILDDLEVASHDATCGRVDLRLDELESGVDHEKWWPIIDDRDQQVGEMYMKVQLDETIVLMSHEYEPMSELLHAFPNNLTINMVHVLPTELSRLSELLLNIFQVSGQAPEWIAALVEDEIDGFGKDQTTNVHHRFRYTARLHSNDSKESGHDREVIVRDLGRSATIEANLLFRGNSLLTKALDMHMRRLGKEYLEETIGERVRDLDESDPDCEVDPMRTRPEDLDRNWRNLIGLTSLFWKSIAGSASRCPSELRRIFRHVRACAEDRYGDFLRSVTYSSVSGFLFLRFFCPAILNPKLFGLMKEHPRPRAQRTLTLIAKALQGLANMTTFGGKEPWMEPMNKFLLMNRSAFKEFVDTICSIPAERPAQIVTPQYATPIQILGRLPVTSREGFPSLPFLIDHARSFAALIKLWLRSAPSRLNELEELDPNIARFNTLALELQQRTRECFGKAEQAERPNGTLEVKWEELVESMDRSTSFYDDDSKPTTPATETPLTASAVVSSHRNSVGYFATRPVLPRRSTDTGGEDDEDTPPSSSSATWEQQRLPFTLAKPSDLRESAANSQNSSQYSLDEPEHARSRQSTIGRETSSKLRLLDFVPGPSRRKNKD
ncbi:putative GTPase activating protein [Talaromyces proteolyticus]|uniref:GTPase activating protein n=1 Tax=Talaromyces proteolyticus TaxID=1131652 RepID=A0AAD4KV90_9EURO|nr:putative GTPase activating protein [Talaromyces proteolyticus]KAH8701863.1 putative GTPase activating protein [Talaromyces proteolyticus]